MKNYIRKAASPIQKNSAPNLASKAAHKLATSDDMDAGEKEDKKAFNRGQGIQRAAKKLYSRTSDKEIRKEEVIDERNTNVKDAGKTKAVFKVGKAKPIPGHPDYKGPQNPEANKKPKLNDSPGNMKEEGKWDETDDGKAYRAMSPEEKHQHKLKKQVMRKSKELKGDKKTYAKEEALVSMLNDMIDRYQLDEASVISKSSSSAEKKMAANKIFRMHQAKQAAKATPKNDAGARAAKRDSAGYKTSDDSHLYKKPSKPEPKRGRGERDLPHIATQLRGVVDMGDKHSGVKFKDGSTKKVSPEHAKSWLKKHDSSKPQDRLAMYKSHDSHSEFQKHK